MTRRIAYLASTVQRGFTVVELLIALTLGAFLVGGMLQLYVGSKKAYNIQQVMTELQEVGRFSLNTMVSDIRMAGFMGCGRSDGAINVLTGSTTNWEYDTVNAFAGWEGGASTFPTGIAAQVVSDTDAFKVTRAIPSDDYVIQSHATGTGTFTLTGVHDLQQNDLLMVTDCLNSAVFQMTNANGGAATTVVHAQGAGTPGNCSLGLGAPLDCTSTTGTPYQFGEDAFLMRMTSRIYYIGTGASGRNALFRQAMNNDGSMGAAVELADGVQDMQIVYGLDTTNDGAVDQYRRAAWVTTNGRWDEVMSVNINLLLQSADDRVTDAPQSYVLIDGTAGTLTSVTPTDRRMRRVFTATTTIRNRAIL